MTTEEYCKASEALGKIEMWKKQLKEFEDAVKNDNGCVTFKLGSDEHEYICHTENKELYRTIIAYIRTQIQSRIDKAEQEFKEI